MSKLLDVEALAERFGLNAAHVRDRLSKRRDFPPAYRIGGALRWKDEDIDEWIEKRRVPPAARGAKRQTSRKANESTSGAK